VNPNIPTWESHGFSRVEDVNPADVYPVVAKRCITELRKMQTNAELNETDPTTVWEHLS
jgi:hypothetical protein